MFVIWQERSEHKEGPSESLDLMEEDHGGDRTGEGLRAEEEEEKYFLFPKEEEKYFSESKQKMISVVDTF